MLLTVSLDHVATQQVTKIKTAWHLLTNEQRERMVRDCHFAAVVVAKGHPVNIALGEHDSYSLQQLREVLDQWQYVHPDARSTIIAAMLRSIAA